MAAAREASRLCDACSGSVLRVKCGFAQLLCHLTGQQPVFQAMDSLALIERLEQEVLFEDVRPHVPSRNPNSSLMRPH